MANKKFVVRLDTAERGRLNDLISKGKAAAKTILKEDHAVTRAGSPPASSPQRGVSTITICRFSIRGICSTFV